MAATTSSDPAMEVEAEAPPPPSLPQPQSGQLAGAGAGAGAGGDEEAALLMSKAPSMSMLNEKELLRQHREAGRRTIQNFLRSYKCYDVVRQSGKVVVFDTNIPFQLAFYALVEHDTQVAPLWDSGARKFVGIMVITDFIDTVRDYYKGNVSMAEVATKSIAQVVRDPEGHRMLHSEFAHGVADDSIYHACELIVKRKLRYLPIVNPEQQLMLSVLSQLDILEYLVNTFREERRLFDQSVHELGIGVFGTVVTMPQTSRLIDVLEVMERRNISAVPIVDEEGRIIDLYHRADVTFIALAGDAEQTMSNLDMRLTDLLHQRRGSDALGAGNAPYGYGFGGGGVDQRKLHMCSQHDSLQQIFERFSQVKFQTLVCVDTEQRCTGVVAIGDLVAYFID